MFLHDAHLINGNSHEENRVDHSLSTRVPETERACHTVQALYSDHMHKKYTEEGRRSYTSAQLKPSLDLINIRLVLGINLHLIFHALICVNHRAVIPPAKVQADGFQ